MKKVMEKLYESTALEAVETENEVVDTEETKPAKKKKFKMFRAAFLCLILFTIICGVIYPLCVTLVAQTAFPYEANGSQITVTLADGTQKIYGSELIGQNFENPKYLFGRVNSGAPTNLSPESEEYKKLLEERIVERREKLAAIGYTDKKDIPVEIISSSGSGVDPHISPEAAYFQVGAILHARNSNVTEADKITEDEINAIIKKYTEGRFLWIFGEERVNVLLVNLALDGLL